MKEKEREKETLEEVARDDFSKNMSKKARVF
jgi:hypothetical protein